MIGVVPGSTQSFEVYGDFHTENLVEGKLYYHPNTQRLYFYSTKENRSNPRTGWFPVWDGSRTYSSKFSNQKYFDKDAIKTDLTSLSSRLNKEVADQVLYNQRRCDNDEILDPVISSGDNMFTQCIKGIIKVKKITMIDLVDMSNPKLKQKEVENYYSALTKITFMRLDKWNIWINVILHMRYIVEIYKGDKMLVSYSHPEDYFETGIVKYDSITSKHEDPFKRMIKILMVMENINKTTLKSDEIDDYTINNMMTTLNGSKSLSAQLFSRFIRMAHLSYMIRLMDMDGTLVFEYKE